MTARLSIADVRSRLFIALGVILATLSGCSVPAASDPPAAARCRPEAAQSLVGKVKPTDAEAMTLTNSTSVRQIEPGQPVTHDFREERVTIETHQASGLVVAASCG